MEYIWIIIVILGWIISAAKKAEEKQKKAQAKQARASQPVNHPQPVTAPSPHPHPTHSATPASGGFTKPVTPQPAAPAPRPSLSAAQPTRPAAFVSAHAEPMETHMHTPVMGDEGTGTEGIDCCHEYMLTSQEEAEPLDILSLNEADQQERAQALLQGVIFSEILGRRRVKRYGRRSA